MRKAMTKFILLSCATLVMSGCMQIDTHIKLERDGSGTVTERVVFSRRLLELSGPSGSDTDIAGLLSKATAEERVKHFGTGAKIAKDPVIRDVEGGGREMLTVYHIDDFAELRYVSPFLCMKDYREHNSIKFTFNPHYEYDKTYLLYQAGELGLQMAVIGGPVGQTHDPSVPSPAAMQMLRDLEPVFQDMLSGFKLKVTFQAYCGFNRSYWGNRTADAVTGSIELFSISDRDLDSSGARFFDNEEIMLELLQGQFAKKNVVQTVKGWPQNPTLPVLHDWGAPAEEGANWRAANEVLFRPSQALFDRYYKGHELELYVGSGQPPVKRQASFDEIGNR
jgi:hypothetical protein